MPREMTRFVYTVQAWATLAKRSVARLAGIGGLAGRAAARVAAALTLTILLVEAP